MINKKIALKKDFEFIEYIGRGLSSEVYRGLRFDENTEFSEVVAIKVFKSSRFRKKYHSELKNLSKINHPNVITIKDWGEFEQKFYLVTEYVHGQNLQEALKAICCTDAKLKKYILNQIHAGIHELKNKNIAHGDLKPSNIMLSVSGQVKLVDISFNEIGDTFATPEFSAPEVLSGARPSFKSDLYSLGKVADTFGIELKKSLLLEPGDRTFEEFKNIDLIEARLNLSKFVLSAIMTGCHEEEKFESTQELNASQIVYEKSRSAKSIFKIVAEAATHLALATIFGISILPDYPQIKVLKLRSLKAYEYWNEQRWVSLPADINILFQSFAEKKIKLRSPKGEAQYRVSADMDFSKKVIIDAL